MENKALKIIGRIFGAIGTITASCLWLWFTVACWEKGVGIWNFGWKTFIIDLLQGKNQAGSFGICVLLALPPLVAWLLFTIIPESVARIFPKCKRMPLWYTIPAFLVVGAAFLLNISLTRLSEKIGFLFSTSMRYAFMGWYIILIPVVFVLCMLPPLAAKIVELCRTRCRHVPSNLLLSSARICFLILIAYVGVIAALFLSNCFAPYSFVQGFCRKNATSAILAFVSLVCAPIGEEIAFRGVMCRSLSRRITLWPALLFSSLLFGIWHRNIPQFVYTVPMGIVYGYAYMMTGKLRHSILMHFVNNLISILAFSEGPTAVFGEHPQLVALCKTLFDFPTALSAVCLVVCFAIIVVCFWAIHLLQKALAPQNQI